MRYLSVCSGIEAATVAWHPLGWSAAAFSEVAEHPRAVLRHHYPSVPLHGDFTTIEQDDYGAIDLLVGGTPCQDFSASGFRAGLDGDRGNLSLQFCALARRKRPEWVVWENVPGVLSTDGGRAFGAILGGLAVCGYGFAYRVLDAQYFGLPQRRRRVFVVGYLGDWRRAAAVLFERHSLSGHSAPRREAREAVAALTANGVGTCGADDNQGQAGHLIAFGGGNTSGPIDVATAQTAQTAHGVRMDFDTETFIAFSAKDYGADALENCSPTLRAGGFRSSHANAGVMPAVAFAIMPMNSGKDYKARETDVAQPLMAGGQVGGNQGGDFVCQPVAFDMRGREDGAQLEGPHDTVNIHAASGGSSRSYVAASAVRRLTPRECERLQGFPDDYTLIPYRGKPAADGPRYKALGNSMSVPVMRWIGERIAAVAAMDDASRTDPDQSARINSLVKE